MHNIANLVELVHKCWFVLLYVPSSHLPIERAKRAKDDARARRES